MIEKTLQATLENVPAATAFIEAALEEAGCSMKAQMQIDVAIDELFANIARYAYQEGSGTVTFRLETMDNPLRILLTFIDDGMPYNPLEKEMPDTTSLPANKRPIGGLGLFMVKKTMDSVTYSYEKGKNILSILKIL